MNSAIANKVLERSQGLCEIEGCKNKKLAKGYCRKHYSQVRRHGEIQIRNRNSPNEIINCGDYSEVILCDNNGNEKARTVIDNDDITKIQKYKWCLTPYGYAESRAKENIKMHRLIMGFPERMEIDHINGDPLDNRKSNLRICTRSQNARNICVRKDSTSGATGVRFHKQWGWQAYVSVNGKHKHLGWYKTREEAIKVRLENAIKYYGDYATTRGVINE